MSVAEKIPTAFPTSLEAVPRDLWNKILPDVSVSIILYDDKEKRFKTDCKMVSFKIDYYPGFAFREREKNFQAIEWRVTDKIFDVPVVVGEGTAYLPAKGGDCQITLNFALPPDAEFHPDWSNEWIVEVDPHKKLFERDETNNVDSKWGQCIG